MNEHFFNVSPYYVQRYVNVNAALTDEFLTTDKVFNNRDTILKILWNIG